MVSFDAFRAVDGTPVYLQIIRYIKRGAVAGTIRDGDELPSRRVLSALLAVAAAPLLSGIVGLLGGTDGFALAAAAVLVIGTGIGVGCIAAVQKKYNGGMF